MKLLLKLFPAGNLVISVLFIVSAFALIAFAWGVFVHFNHGAELLEPEALEAAKLEDHKVDAKK